MVAEPDEERVLVEAALLELVQELYALTQAKPRVELQWIRAHEGTRWNEYADALAALGA